MPSPDQVKPTPLRELLGFDAGDRSTSAPAAAEGSSNGRRPAASGDAPAPGPAERGGRREPGRPRRAGGPPSAARSGAPAAATPRFAVVDGSNVAHAGEGTSARLANILLMRDKLVADGYHPLVLVDAALRHQIDDPDGYERLVAEGEVKQAPAGTDADYFILAFAKELGAAVVSNDQFRDRSRQFSAVRRRTIRYMILAGEVVLEKRTTRRADGR